MPMKSFLTRTSPSLGSGTGRSVLYCRTSVPPVFSTSMPFMVFGMWVEDAMVRDRGIWLLKRASRDVGLVRWLGIFVRMQSDWKDMQLSINEKILV